MTAPEQEPSARNLLASDQRVTLRPFLEGDVPAVVAIERRVFSNPWSEEAFRAFLRSGIVFSQVVLVGREVVGYALGWCVGSEAELANLAVAPRWQRLSLGSTLVRWTLAACAQRGATAVFLEVRASNEAAQRLYRRLGFEEYGRRRSYYTNPREDALVFRAQVDSPVRPSLA